MFQKSHRVTAAVLAAILFLFVSAFGLYHHFRSSDTTVFAPASRQHHMLIIDPGHGGEDGGAVSVSGVPESGINLAIALKCEQVAGLFGLPVQLLRQDDSSLADDDSETLREKKRSDLETRVEIVNGTENALLLSIHQNNFTQPEYSGAQVFFRPEQQSQLWASKMQEQLRNGIDPENRRQPKEIPEDIYLMSHIDCPAILVECGFLSNPQEDQLLQTSDYQCRLAVVLTGTCLEHWT